MDQQAFTKMLLDLLTRNLEEASQMKDDEMEAQNLSKTKIKKMCLKDSCSTCLMARAELISDHPITINHFTWKKIQNSLV